MEGAGSELECRRVAKRFEGERGPVEALAGVDLVARAGEFVALVGPSGCGKSTLFNIVAGLETPTAGDVCVDGRSVVGRPGAAAYMPQRDLLLPGRGVPDTAALPLGLAGGGRAAARREAARHFERFGLAGFERA